ncbi:hypothetical protein Afil01_06590 [Actinorhabdospora filicis]|uniref:MmpS family membrane protein n=1 Tax=Actinorhabdospora filicis TaxID=1785913 RepID=A0A9W6SH30_9ACTN|nr:hypothetical protein [Actinorhabdospora filicis]GLZ75852.1 hypothetical protein Afil01_06590 [Actinorhabdospora filicis]
MKKYLIVTGLTVVALVLAACNRAPSVDAPAPAVSGSSSHGTSANPSTNPSDHTRPGSDKSDGPANPGKPAGAVNVVLKLTGKGDAYGVEYAVGTAKETVTSAKLPWGHQLKANPGDTVTLRATTTSGAVTCAILVDGKEADTSSGSVASCSYTIP